jgi:hypothetical protein
LLVAIGIVDEFAERMLLVGQGVGQLMGQRDDLLTIVLGRIQHEQAFLLVIVESGGLFGQQVAGFPSQVEIMWHQAEHLEHDFSCVGFLVALGVFDAFFHHFAEVVLGEDLGGDGSLHFPAGDVRKRPEHLVDLRENRLSRGGRGESEKQEDARQHLK